MGLKAFFGVFTERDGRMLGRKRPLRDRRVRVTGKTAVRIETPWVQFRCRSVTARSATEPSPTNNRWNTRSALVIPIQIISSLLETSYMKDVVDSHVDIEALIVEVQKYPEIWNTRCEAYTDKSRKKSAWMQISQATFEGFEDRSCKEKDEISNCLSKKWRNIKDTYLKTVKKTRAGLRCRTYLYAKHLNFVKQAYLDPDYELSSNPDQPESNENSCDEESGLSTYPPTFSENQDDDSTSSVSAQKNTKRKRKLSSSEYYPNLASIKIEQSMQMNDIVDTTQPMPPSQSTHSMKQPPASSTFLSSVSANQAFFNSLLPIVDGFTDMEVVDFRLDVLNIIKRMQKTRQIQNNKQS